MNKGKYHLQSYAFVRKRWKIFPFQTLTTPLCGLNLTSMRKSCRDHKAVEILRSVSQPPRYIESITNVSSTTEDHKLEILSLTFPPYDYNGRSLWAYLVESDGDILLVLKGFRYEWTTNTFSIFRLDLSTLQWIKMKKDWESNLVSGKVLFCVIYLQLKWGTRRIIYIYIYILQRMKTLLGGYATWKTEASNHLIRLIILHAFIMNFHCGLYLVLSNIVILYGY